MRLFLAHTLNKGVRIVPVSDCKKDRVVYVTNITSLGSKRNHEIPLAPETIDVDDNSVLDSITPRDNNHTSIGNSSPDELNMLSPSAEGVHSSKYPFNISSHHPAVRNSNPRIVADGENTEWANKAFSQDSSDCIPNRNTGQVREQVERFEAQSRKIDFNDFIYKSKNRMKPVRPLSFRAG